MSLSKCTEYFAQLNATRALHAADFNRFIYLTVIITKRTNNIGVDFFVLFGILRACLRYFKFPGSFNRNYASL